MQEEKRGRPGCNIAKTSHFAVDLRVNIQDEQAVCFADRDEVQAEPRGRVVQSTAAVEEEDVRESRADNESGRCPPQ